MARALPQPPQGVPIIDPRTGEMDIRWQNYFLSLTNAVPIIPPIDAKYWVSKFNAELTDETNLGALSSGYLKITTAAATATPSTVASIPGTDITGAALTRTNDTNVTVTLGGTPATSLLRAASLTLGWQGQLGLSRGGTDADLSSTGGASEVVMQEGVGDAFTVRQLTLADISGAGTTRTAYGAGTAYGLTNAMAAIDFGTTDPAITLTAVGTYVLFGQVLLAYNGATVVAETASVKIRRTNNTAADLSAVVLIDLPVATTLTHSYGIVTIPPVVYTTAAVNDALALYGQVSATLGAGSIDATAVGTSLVAMRIAA